MLYNIKTLEAYDSIQTRSSQAPNSEEADRSWVLLLPQWLVQKTLVLDIGLGQGVASAGNVALPCSRIVISAVACKAK